VVDTTEFNVIAYVAHNQNLRRGVIII